MNKTRWEDLEKVFKEGKGSQSGHKDARRAHGPCAQQEHSRDRSRPDEVGEVGPYLVGSLRCRRLEQPLGSSPERKVARLW